MLILQVLINGVVLGCLYACIAAGFSLVWGVLNVINLTHGSLIVLGSSLVVYPAELPGLEGMVLLGCKYRIEGLTLLDDPAEAWRRRAPAPPAPDGPVDAAPSAK